MINNFSGKYEFLSNFYEKPFTHCGVEYKTSEHAFQALKCAYQSDAKMIIEADTPGKAKRLGRKVTMRPDWDVIKFSIMYDILKSKFSDPVLKQKLLDTGDATLIEGTTWHDNIWGDCSCDACKNIVGQNHLGKTLMRVRSELREGG